MMKKIISFIKNNDLKIIYTNNSLNIINYDKIIDVTDNNIKLIKDNKVITVNGNKLRLSKLLDNEILIIGIINKIEL